jgi:hypothetical protein
MIELKGLLEEIEQIEMSQELGVWQVWACSPDKVQITIEDCLIYREHAELLGKLYAAKYSVPLYDHEDNEILMGGKKED